MRANAIALSALLLGASNAEAATAGHFGAAYDAAQAAVGRTAAVQLADGGKLADKYIAGKAGGAKGIGGQKDKKDGKQAR